MCSICKRCPIECVEQRVFICLHEFSSATDWTLTRQVLFISFWPFPDLICYNPVFYAELTCHSQPTYPDVLFQLRLNSRPLWHSACGVHSGEAQKDPPPPPWSWLAVETSIPFASILGISHFIPWHLTLRLRGEFSEIAAEEISKLSNWALPFKLHLTSLSRLKTSASL